MARKDDPVFNVKFVQLVENQACLWNYTHPGYSKKEEVQKAWQHVANEIKDTVRNSRERWRTIRSSFLRSLKLARTQTGRGKRKYYLSKYLQFLIPYTKSRACHKQLPANANGNAHGHIQPNSNPSASPNAGMVLRKPSTSTAATFLAAAALHSSQPMTRIGHMRLLSQYGGNPSAGIDEDTKESSGSGAAETQTDAAAEEEEEVQQQQQQVEHGADGAQTPLRLQAIKVEQQQQQQQQQHCNDKIVAAAAQQSMAAALRNNMDWTELTEWLKSSSNQLQLHQLHNNNNNNSSSNGNMLLQHGHVVGVAASTPPPAAGTPAPPAAVMAPAAVTGAPPDADYSFLISLHPYLKEMSGKQNRRFRQKVVGLIDNVLDNVDV